MLLQSIAYGFENEPCCKVKRTRSNKNHVAGEVCPACYLLAGRCVQFATLARPGRSEWPAEAEVFYSSVKRTNKTSIWSIYIYMLCIWMLLRAKFHKHETQQLAARAGVLWLSPAWSQWFCRISRHLQGVQPGSCPCASAGALQCSVSRPPVQATHLSPQKTLTIRIATLERCK